MREEEVGICFNANSVPGFSAVLKQRFSDFKVNEVGKDGVVAHLTTALSPSTPKAGTPSICGSTQPRPARGAEPEAEASERVFKRQRLAASGSEAYGAGQGEVVTDTQFAKLRTLVGDSDERKVRAFLAAIAVHKERPTGDAAPDPILLEAMADKEQRRSVHELFKQPGFGGLETETHSFAQDDNGPKLVRIKIAFDPQQGTRASPHTDRRRGRWPSQWAGGSKKYLQFVLYKENMDTQAAIGLLSRNLQMHWSSFGFAGTKDKRGATAQSVTAFKVVRFAEDEQAGPKVSLDGQNKQFSMQVDPERLISLNERLQGLQTGNYCFVADPLYLGALAGNVFDLILRDVKATFSQVSAAAEAVRKTGFINYFGLQRFGSETAPTHRIGCALLKGDWDTAINLIMESRPGERPKISEARNIFLKTRNAKAACAMMPPSATAEKAILMVGPSIALKQLCWMSNPVEVLARRGLQENVRALLNIPKNLRLLYLHAVQSFLWNSAASARARRYGVDRVVSGDVVLVRQTVTGFAEARAGAASDDEAPSVKRLQAVHVVTASEAADAVFQVTDVVLPLPGSQIIYPDNDIAETYLTEAAKCGVTLNLCEHTVRDFAITSLPGDYRTFLHRPEQLDWQLLAYTNHEQDLGYTDLDALQQKPLPDFRVLVGDDEVQGCFKALRLRFRLPPSCYATMLLREFLKDSTESAEHKSRTLLGRTAAQQ